MNKTMDKGIFKAFSKFYLDFARYGAEIEQRTWENRQPNKPLTFFITVPRTSHLKLENGKEAVGEELAKYLKDIVWKSMTDGLATDDRLTKYNLAPEQIDQILAGTRPKIKFKVREDDWTREKEEQSTLAALAKQVVFTKFLTEYEK